MTIIIDMGEYNYETYISEEDMLRGYTIEGKWKEVEQLYKSDPEFSTIKINESRGTALHVAVNDDNEEVVRNLVDSIISHRNEKALECKNEKGDTPLHLAASGGFKDMCECLIGKNGERKYLIDIENNNGENPLFLASLSWHKRTFVYLFNFIPSEMESYVDDLALIIIDKYPDLIVISNRHGYSPLKLLATRPSAFKSGCKMIWWKSVIYHCIPMETLNVVEAVNYVLKQYESSSSHHEYPWNYETCNPLVCFVKRLLIKDRTAYGPRIIEDVFQSYQHRNIRMQSEQKLVPENYATCLRFMKFACLGFMKFAYIILVFFGVGIEEIKKMKEKHKWSGQLLNILMENPYESYLGSGAKSTRYVDGTDFFSVYKPDQGITENNKMNSEELKILKTLESETAMLTAARNGIVEIVDELITKIPSALYDVNSENKNVLLVAVENRKTIVVERIRKLIQDWDKYTIFYNLIQCRDVEENTVLHLAATIGDRDWHISGSAMKMMWHIKWFQYIKGLVPEHFLVRTNKDNQTAEELFKKSCATLVQEGSAWFKGISESCSVVAVLLAGVAFATSSTVPGGNKSDTGEPILKGNPAFDTFAMSSLIGLCFSVTALIMFLSILTTQKEASDFRINLPRKLLLGLSSLFLSMVALFVAFCSSHFFLIDHKFKHIVFLFYTVTGFPLTSYAVAQLPLYIDLLRGIVTKVPMTGNKDN